jgi:hypothetical protein
MRIAFDFIFFDFHKIGSSMENIGELNKLSLDQLN